MPFSINHLRILIHMEDVMKHLIRALFVLAEVLFLLDLSQTLIAIALGAPETGVGMPLVIMTFLPLGWFVYEQYLVHRHIPVYRNDPVREYVTEWDIRPERDKGAAFGPWNILS